MTLYSLECADVSLRIYSLSLSHTIHSVQTTDDKQTQHCSIYLSTTVLSWLKIYVLLCSVWCQNTVVSPEGQELSQIRSDAVNSHTACHAVSQFRSNGTVLVNVCVDFLCFWCNLLVERRDIVTGSEYVN